MKRFQRTNRKSRFARSLFAPSRAIQHESSPWVRGSVSVEPLEHRNLLSADFGYVLPGTGFNQQGQAMAADAAGNVYLIASNDTVAKYDSAGNLMWFTPFSTTGTGTQAKNSIAIDGSGNLYISGSFGDSATFGSTTLFTGSTNKALQDAYVAKLNSSGVFQWAKGWISASGSQSNSLAVDPQGGVYIGGTFLGAAIPGGTNIFVASGGGTNQDALIAKYDTSGNFVWADQVGGAGTDDLRGLSADAAGNVYATGKFSGVVDFDPGGGVYNLDGGFFNSAYVLKLDSTGNLRWAEAAGSINSSTSAGMALAVDSTGNVYTTGVFSATVDLDPTLAGVSTFTSPGIFENDGYVQKLDTNGNFIWVRQLHNLGSNSINPQSISLDSTGNVYTTGIFQSSVDFNSGGARRVLSSAGWNDAYLSEFDSRGNYVWATSFGSTSDDGGEGILVDGSNNIYLTGYFWGTVDFDPGAATTQFRNGFGTSFLLKLTQASIGGQVFNDQNGNGLHDVAERGLGGVAVSLYQSDDVLVGNSDDQFVASAVTDSQGRYKFVGVGSNTNFYVQIRTPVGFNGFSPQFVGGNPNLWSTAGADGTTGAIPVIPLSNNVANVGLLGTAPSFGFALAPSATGSSRPNAIATDALGDVYYAGALTGTANFDQGAGTFNLTGANGAFIAKYSPAGALLWAEQIPVGSSQGITSLKVDALGNVFALGMFSGDVDFDPSPSFQFVNADAALSPFILQLDQNGALVWAHELAAGSVPTAGGLALDSADNVYATGSFSGTVNFNPSGTTAANLTSQGSTDAFIAKYDRYGNYVWAEDFGGSFNDVGNAIAVDKAGNVFTTGSFTSSASITIGTFLPTTYTLTGGGGAGTSFVLALDPTGNYLWAQAFVAGVSSSGASIATDAAGNVVSTGSFSGPATFGGLTPLSGKSYVAKLDNSGNFVWADALDTDPADPAATIQSSGIATGPAGNVYLTGSFKGTADFDPGLGLANLTSQNSSTDPFVLKLDANGVFNSVATGGGPGADQSNAIAVDASGNAFAAGVVSGVGNFNPAGTPSFPVGQAAATNLFLWKISPSVNVAPSFTTGPNISVGEDTGLNTFPLWATNISAGPASESGQRLTFNVTNDNVALFDVPPAIDPSTGTLSFTLAPFAVGVANVSVLLQDSGGIANGGVDTSLLQTFTITVNFVNHAPSFIKGANQTTNEGAGSRVVSGWATGISPGAGPNDVGQNLDFIVTTDNPGLFDIQPAISAVTGTLTYTLATYSSGVANVTVRLHDDGGTANGGIDVSAAQTFTITANFVNHAPSFTVGANQTVNEDAGAVSVNDWATNVSPGPGSNEAGQTLDFIVANDNPSLFSVQPAVDVAGKLTYTVAPNTDGIAHVTIKLHDDGGTANGGADTSAAQTFTIAVDFVNEAPSFIAGPSQVQFENSGSVFIPGWATSISPGVGANESNQTLNFIVVASNPSLFLVQPSIDPLTGDLSYVLADNVSGASTASVQLQDNGGTANGGVDTSAVQQFGITVMPVNQAPSFTAGPNVSALENSGPQSVANWATNLSAGPANEINQALNFTVTTDNPALFSVQPAIDAVTGALTYAFAANTSGTANVTVRLHDNGGTANGGVDTSAPQTFTITSIFVNQAPSFLKGLNQSALEGSGAHSVAWASNISPGNGNQDAVQTLNFIVSTDNPALFSVQPAVNPANGALTYTLAPYTSGVANVSIQLHDDGGTANGGVDTSPLQTFTITVTFVNQAPSFIAGSNQTLNEDAGPQTIAGWATNISPGPGANEGSQALSFTVTNDNAALFDVAPALDPLTGTLTYTPAANVSGTATVTVRLHDDGGTANGGVDTSAAQTFTISINAVNDAPSFTAGPNQTVNENTGPFTVNSWATNISPGPGANEASQTVDFIVTTDNPGLFSQQPAIDPFTGSLSYKPATNASGVANVSVQLHDNGGTANGGVETSTVQAFTITVNLINSAPSFVKGADQTVNENSGAHSVANWATAISPGVSAAEASQTLNFIVTNDNTAMFSQQPAIDPLTGTLTYALAANASGTAHVSVSLKDNGGTANGGKDASATQTFAINANFVNNAPSFAIGPDQNVNQDTGAHAVLVWATNISPGPGANEAAQLLSFIVTNDNNSLFSVQPAVSPSGSLTYTLAPGAVGTAQVTVALNDSGGTANGGVDASATQTFAINVNHVNHAPTVSAPVANQVMNENGADIQLSLAGVFADADIANFADLLTYSIFSNDNPGLLTGSLNGNSLLLHLAPNQFGTAHLNVRATDTAFASVDDLLTVSVNPVNNAPAFIPGPGQLVNLNAGHVTVPSWATGISAGPANESNQALNFIATNDNNLLFFVQPTISASGTLDYTLSPGAFGSAHVTVRLHDSGGTANGGVDTSAPVTFLIQVKAPPVANSDTYVLSTLNDNTTPDVGGVLANDSNPYGDPVTVRIITAPTHGTVTLNADGSFAYTKGSNFVALDRFTYRIIDGSASSNSTTVTVMSYEASTVVKLYQQVLHRAPDDAGLTYWTNLVQNGQPYSVVAQGVFESNERLNPIIQQYFQEFLLRPADAQGLAYWRDQVWKRDGGPENVIAGMISSPEFFQSAGATNAGWVAALYQRLLNRTPDAQGLAYWVQALNSHQLTESQVVLGFLKSDESFQNLITDFYQQYLGRNPSSSELANYVAQMRSGATQRDVQLSLIASDEYRNSPAPPALGSMTQLS